MKLNTIAAVTTALALTVATAAYAQGRHDEKAHGTKAPAEAADKPVPVGSGRHDEKPHATFKSEPKKQAPKSGDTTNQGTK